MQKSTGQHQLNPTISLVLGGGGVAGIAWLTGLLLGLEDKGLNTKQFSQIIGTSAGATVAAQISSHLDLTELFERQVRHDCQVAEIKPKLFTFKLLVGYLPVLWLRNHPLRLARQLGRMALRSKTISSAQRLAVITERLPTDQWPDIDLQIVAVDTETGEATAFNKASGVPLLNAVAASSAVPGVWPPVSISQHYYIDGAVRSNDNADLANGTEKVLILSPMGNKRSLNAVHYLEQQLAVLKQEGAQVLVVKPDGQARAVIGNNLLDPDKRQASAIAGREQGRREAQHILRFLAS